MAGRQMEFRPPNPDDDKVLPTGRVKNLRQGVAGGVGTILSAAVGAAGVAVLTPVAGASMGAERGGILGGILGFGGGAVAGALGAASIAVVGALSGAVQVGKGVIAVPQQVVAPMRGKWWNEQEGRWVLTDMTKEAKWLEGIPADDNDILGKIQEDLDQGAGHTDESFSSATVVDTTLYDALEIAPDADQSTIKRRYYVLARKYHPDKNPDQESAEKFKTVSEAYHVLSDPELRKKYNQVGLDVLKNDPTELTPMVDPKTLFAFLFGSDKFQHVFGNLATSTSASIGDSDDITLADARRLQKRRVTRLAIKLIERITPWVKEGEEGSRSEQGPIVESWKKEGEELSKTSFGYPLVKASGEAYYLVATMYAGSLESGQCNSLSNWMSGKRATFEKRRADMKNRRNQFSVGLQMADMQFKFKEKMEAAKTDEERAQVARDAEEAVVELMVGALWTTTVVDITSTLYETCQMVFNDQSVDKTERKYRARAVALLGKSWMDIPEPDNGDEGQKDFKRLYEEAAFAAMTETLKRKGEAEPPESEAS